MLFNPVKLITKNGYCYLKKEYNLIFSSNDL